MVMFACLADAVARSDCDDRVRGANKNLQDSVHCAGIEATQKVFRKCQANKNSGSVVTAHVS